MTKFVSMTAFLIGLTASFAGHAEQAVSRSYHSTEAISHAFGSKRAVGYFAPQNGACALTMFLTDAEDGYLAPPPARIRFAVKPGEAAELSSADGPALEVKCTAGAAAVEVRQIPLTTAAAATQ
jgi:hypothetical protein